MNINLGEEDESLLELRHKKENLIKEYKEKLKKMELLEKNKRKKNKDYILTALDFLKEKTMLTNPYSERNIEFIVGLILSNLENMTEDELNSYIILGKQFLENCKKERKEKRQRLKKVIINE